MMCNQLTIQTIDHNKLLCTMHDLGSPKAVIEVIADLCTDATIKIGLCFAATGPEGKAASR